MISAFIAATTNAVEIISSKEIMNNGRVSYANYLSISTPFVFIFTFISFIFLGEINTEQITQEHLILFSIMIIIGFFHNILYFYGLNHEKVSDVEPIAMMTPVVVILFATIFYESERNTEIIFLAIVASLALLFSRIKKHHLRINNYSMAIIGSVFLFSIDALIAKKLLEVFSPTALYSLRIGFLSLLFIIYFRPAYGKYNLKKYAQMGGVGLIVSIQYILLYHSIKSIGIVLTELIMLLSPVIILILSKILLKETISLKNGFADAVILACVAGAILIQ